MMLFPGIDGVIGPNHRLRDVAAALGRAVQSLKDLAARGEFPRVFRLSRNDWRVERDDLLRWARGAWASGASADVRADAVRRSFRQPAKARRTGSG